MFDVEDPSAIDPSQFKIHNLDATHDPSKFILFARNKRLGSVGNFVAITGKPKARKSAFAQAIISAAITRAPQLDFSVNLLPAQQKVLLIDTEQDRNDLAVSLSRLKHQAQISSFTDHNNLDVYSVSMLDPAQVINFIHQLLRSTPGVGLVVIDGLLDLINDMNDVKECRQLLQTIKTWAITYNVLFVAVLHQSKNSGFSIGHLGSFTDRKAQAVLSIDKNDDDSSTCSAQYIRSDATFEPITIYYNFNIKAYAVEFSADKIAARNKKKKE